LFAKKQVINVSGASCEKLTELAFFAFSVFLRSETVGCALVYLRKDARVLQTLDLQMFINACKTTKLLDSN